MIKGKWRASSTKSKTYTTNSLRSPVLCVCSMNDQLFFYVSPSLKTPKQYFLYGITKCHRTNKENVIDESVRSSQTSKKE